MKLAWHKMDFKAIIRSDTASSGRLELVFSKAHLHSIIMSKIWPQLHMPLVHAYWICVLKAAICEG